MKIIKISNECVEVDGIMYRKVKEVKDKISIWCENNKLKESDFGNPIPCGDYIKFPLPKANKAWTFETFKLIKKACKDFVNAYPKHGESWMDNDALYVFVKNK